MKSLVLAVVVALSTTATGATAAPASTACSAVMTTAANPTEMTPKALFQRASRHED